VIREVSIRSAALRGRSAAASVALKADLRCPSHEFGEYRLDHKLRRGHESGDTKLPPTEGINHLNYNPLGSRVARHADGTNRLRAWRRMTKP
jgi:hypothetical protein